MRAGADDKSPVPDPRFEELRRSLTTLRERLAAFDAHPGTRLAREGDRLSGKSRSAWQEQEDRAGQARDTLERARLRWAETGPGQPWTEELSQILSDVRQANVAMQEALHVAGRIAKVRTDFVHRLRVVVANATRAGEVKTVARAEELIGLGKAHPLDRREIEVEELERDGFDGGVRAARECLAQLQTARATVERARVRIVGFDPGPLPELGDLDAWLERIKTHLGETSHSSGGEQLGRWQERAEARADPILAAEKVANSLLEVRKRQRGQWTSLREKAGDLGVLERADVDWLIVQIRNELWIAPSDLGRAEDQLITLGKLLND